MVDNKNDTDIAYHSVSPEMDSSDSPRPKIELGNHPQLSQKRGIITTFVVQIFALLWLVPVVALLWLNFSGYIIGATAWCPSRKCWPELFNPVATVPQKKLVAFDKEDHNLLGGLQLVAKALEIWFVFISAALVYIVTMLFAAKHEGLPIGYLTRPIEFADPVTLVDPLLYKTGPHPWGNKSRSDTILGRRVWFLIGLSVALCILCNLMGPATAVLVIPSLQWLQTDRVGQRQFIGLNGAQPPQVNYDSWFWFWTNCYEDDIKNQLFTCTYYPFGAALDQWVQNTMTGSGISTQDGLTFRGNNTADIKGRNYFDVRAKDVMFWAPNRQIMSNLSSDTYIISSISQGFSLEDVDSWNGNDYRSADPIETYAEYNKSRELEITRNGPISGAFINMWYDFNHSSNLFTVDVDSHRQIRCYKEYDLYYTPLNLGSSEGTYTKCMRVGSGWSDVNKKATFSVTGKYDSQDQDKHTPGVNVTIYSSDKVAYFEKGVYPSWLPEACLQNTTRLNSTYCDWDRLFTVDPESKMANRSTNVNTIEYLMADGDSSVNFVADFAPLLAFTNYSFDPSPFTNPTQFVKTSNLPNSGKSVHIDPAWVLAAFATDAGGVLEANRTMTNFLVEQVGYLFQNQTMDYITTYNAMNVVALLPVWQTLSLVDFNTKPVTGTDQTVDPEHPLLQRHARIYVWAFKMGSRTSYLGAAVGILGCLVVLAQVFLGFYDRRRYRSPTQLLVAALEHAPRGEYDGKGHDEAAMAGVRFHIQDDGNHMGKFSFYEPVSDADPADGDTQEKTVR